MDRVLPDFANKYADWSVQAVIEHGKQLQKEKLGNQINKPSLHVLNDEVPCGKKYQHGSRARNTNLTTTQHSAPARSTYTIRSAPTRYNGHRSTSPGFVVSPGSPRSSIVANKGRRLKCPLRIAELAVPSKRHCIETWRDRSDILPNFMAERLKQLVLHQKVVATVPDAVQCFKYHRRRESSPPSKRPDSQNRNQRKAGRQDQNIADIKMMCAVFSHRMARRLIKKMNFEHCLSDDLEKLSSVVTDEIRKLIQNRRICADYVYNQELLNEMSGKITMWIVDILNEAQINMLEDELRVKKTNENKMGKDGNLETLIDQYVGWQLGERRSSRLLDLEEQEGPALGAIDTLVENVLDICMIKNESDYESHVDEATMDEATPDEATPDEATPDEVTVGEVSYEDNQEVSATENKVFDKDVINNTPDETGVQDTSETIEKENEDSESQYDSTTADVESNDSKKILEASDRDDNTNVSDVMTLEESLDDRKKVKFSEVKDADRTDESRGIEVTPETGLDEPEPIVKSNESEKGSATLLRTNIVFQPPNPSILSVADESWPDDFMIPPLKPSASVSKSITSLGEIKEVDEPEQHDRKDMESYENSRTSKGTKTTSSSSYNIEQSDENEPNAMLQERSMFPAMNLVQRVPPSKLLDDLKGLIEAEKAEHRREREIKKENYDFNDAESFQGAPTGKGDHIQAQNSNQDDTDTEQNPIVQAIKEKLRQEAKAKFDYRVHPQTAPSWVITSASEDSDPIVGVGQGRRLQPGQLRKWCKDIDHTLINLEQWNKWVDFTCRQILYMKHQTIASSKLPPHERTCVLAAWTKLKKCIDKDAILWRKLNDRTSQVLKMYSPKPKSRKSSPLRLQNKNRNKKESLSEAMLSIEGMSSWLHRSIVSTEHIVRCNCCNPMSRPQTSKPTKKQRKKL